jgi:Holliday junction resolvase RusA-like endonuclease
MLLNLNINTLPPSVNQLYRKNASGAIYTTPKVIEFKKLVKTEINNSNLRPSSKPIKMVVIFSIKDKRKRDLDNLLKVKLLEATG